MRKRQMVKDIIRNIYERDWYTPYSQRPRKWACGWINRKEKPGERIPTSERQPEEVERCLDMAAAAISAKMGGDTE